MQNAVGELHQPVLVETCVKLLAPALTYSSAQQPPVLVDATLGLGGHAEAILRAYPDVRIVGIDRDGQARRLAAQRLAEFDERLTIVAATYGDLDRILNQQGIRRVDAILADLGVSSLQLDEEARGFAYSTPAAPLDMRMDQSQGFSAADFLAAADAAEIAEVLRRYGEEKFAWKIAKNIVAARRDAPLSTCGELADLVKASIPAPARRRGGNPAKRTFQALRVAVNDELGDLQRFLAQGLKALKVGGRMAVESYQSLEDRLVKQAFANGIHPETPKGLPIVPAANSPWLADLTHGAVQADAAEIASNPRSASVRLRAVEKLSEPGSEKYAAGETADRRENLMTTLEKLRRSTSEGD